MIDMGSAETPSLTRGHEEERERAIRLISSDGSLVALNRAEGGAGDGGSAGSGLGGGVYVAPGGIASADRTRIFANNASTSDDDVFGILV